MKFSAEKASRKWPCGGSSCGAWGVVAAAVLLLLGAQPESAAARPMSLRGGFWPEARPAPRRIAIPLPQPRPAEAAVPEDKAEPKSADSEKPVAEQAAPAPPPLSACRVAL